MKQIYSYISVHGIISVSCSHADLSVIKAYAKAGPNDYYKCNDCGQVFICECCKEIAPIFYPSGVQNVTEKGTQLQYEVNGFLPNICEDSWTRI